MDMKNNCWTESLRSAKRLAVVAGFLIGFASSARAQQAAVETPQFEASASYSFIRANPGNGSGGYNLNGGSGSVAYNFSDRFSAVADFGAYRFSGLPSGVTSTMYTYMFGPRITLRRYSRVNPFAQVLLGGGRLNASSGGVDAGENGFAMAIGGGVDVPFRKHLAIRLVQAEYLLTRFDRVNGSSATQNDVRISAGLVFRFGSK
jgi:opacity protein-like surface antigen